MSSWSVKIHDSAKGAKSRDALVAEAQQEREGRRNDKLRIRAIVRIQSALRAHRERSCVMNKVCTLAYLESFFVASLRAKRVQPQSKCSELSGIVAFCGTDGIIPTPDLLRALCMVAASGASAC
jgi:hypothetical protein